MIDLTFSSDTAAFIGAAQSSVGKKGASAEILGFGSASAIRCTCGQARVAEILTLSDDSEIQVGLTCDIGNPAIAGGKAKIVDLEGEFSVKRRVPSKIL